MNGTHELPAILAAAERFALEAGELTLRYFGMGLDVPPQMARILHGATLMDTENRFPGKMTPLDQLWCRIQFKKARYEGMYTPASDKPKWRTLPAPQALTATG